MIFVRFVVFKQTLLIVIQWLRVVIFPGNPRESDNSEGYTKATFSHYIEGRMDKTSSQGEKDIFYINTEDCNKLPPKIQTIITNSENKEFGAKGHGISYQADGISADINSNTYGQQGYDQSSGECGEYQDEFNIDTSDDSQSDSSSELCYTKGFVATLDDSSTKTYTDGSSS